ncbi:MAG: hypothetical protein J6Y37_09060 [Paludibacteraceae bacterium]|nr:hypothetical protein [Paludibacteraceae bacterium]
MPIDFNHITEEEQRNFEFLRERRLAQLAALLMEEGDLSFTDAFHKLYNSKTYELLNNPHSGLYIQSARYIYSYLENEMGKGQTANKALQISR